MTPAPLPVVSILIVNYNGALLLRDCLDSLAKVTRPVFEIIVVDNASQDDSRAVLRNYPAVQLVESPTNCGFAGGNNLGLPRCNGRYLLLLNSDTIVTPDFLAPLCEHLDRYPQVGIVQSRMILPNHCGRLDSCGSFLTRIGFMYHRGFLKLDAPLGEREAKLSALKKEQPLPALANELGAGELTLADILEQLVRPGRDPRADLPAPILRNDVLSMDDLLPGIRLDGTVRNVVDFGAFVDIGVKQDGLLHRTQIPFGVLLQVGDVIKLEILTLEKERGRISLGWVE